MKSHLNATFLVILTVCLIFTSVFVFGGCKPATSQGPAGSGPAAADTGKQIEITFAYFPPPGIAITKAWENWGNALAVASGNRIKFNYKGGSSMGAPPDHYNLAKSGTADMVATCPEFTPGVFPMSAAANLPMLFPTAEVASGALYQFHKKYTADSDFKDVVFLASSPIAPAQLQSTKPVKTLEDLKGMKIITVNDQQAKIIAALGAAPVVMNEGDAYSALERKLADARFKEWDGTMVWKINEVTKYRTANIDLGIDQMIIIMNKDFWNKLPADLQNLIRGSTGLLLSQYCGIAFDKGNQAMFNATVAYDKKVGNPDIYYLPAAERARWEQAIAPITQQWVNDMESKGRPGKAALQDLQNWIKQYTQIYQ